MCWSEKKFAKTDFSFASPHFGSTLKSFAMQIVQAAASLKKSPSVSHPSINIMYDGWDCHSCGCKMDGHGKTI
jgi:hypothetical protein